MLLNISTCIHCFKQILTVELRIHIKTEHVSLYYYFHSLLSKLQTPWRNGPNSWPDMFVNNVDNFVAI